MSETFVKLEITDICDELSEELRQSLFEKQFILVSDLTQNSNSVQFENELISENKRLKNDLKFANNCLNTLNKFKRYLNEIRYKFEYLLDLKEKQELIDLEIEYKLMINTINERIKSKQSFGNNDKPIEKSINGNVFIENYENNQNSNNKEVFSEDKRYNGKEVEENELKSIGKDVEKREELSEISEFICDFIGCNKSFKRRDYLRGHQKIHFPRELNSCKLCSFQTYVRNGLSMHMKRRHPNDRLFRRYKSKKSCKPLAETLFRNTDCGPSYELIDKNVLTNDEVIDIKPNFVEIYFGNDFVNEIELIGENADKTEEEVTEYYEFNDKTTEEINENNVKSNENIIEITDNVFENNIKAQNGRNEEKFVSDLDENESNFDTNFDSDEERDIESEQKVDKECDKCGKRLKTLKEVSEHERNHNRVFSCQYPLCGQRFRKYFEFKKHMNKHLVGLGLNAFKCEAIGCDYQTINYNQLSKHDISIHKLNRVKKDKKFSCAYPDCTKTFWSNHRLITHIASKHEVTEKRKFLCEDPNCNRIFERKGVLIKHMKTHSQSMPITANIRKFYCNLCSYRSKCKLGMEKHQRLEHSNGRPFVCTFCCQTFTLNVYLKEHIKGLHLNLTAYKCPHNDCGREFNTSALRAKHVKQVHKRIAITKSFPCNWPECGFVSKTNYNLKHHKYRHTGERPYACTWPECGKDFRTEPAFQTHMRLHTDDRKYGCVWPGCEFRTTDRSHLRFHKMRHEKQLKISNKSVKTPIKLVKKPIKSAKRKNKMTNKVIKRNKRKD